MSQQRKEAIPVVIATTATETSVSAIKIPDSQTKIVEVVAPMQTQTQIQHPIARTATSNAFKNALTHCAEHRTTSTNCSIATGSGRLTSNNADKRSECSAYASYVCEKIAQQRDAQCECVLNAMHDIIPGCARK